MNIRYEGGYGASGGGKRGDGRWAGEGGGREKRGRSNVHDRSNARSFDETERTHRIIRWKIFGRIRSCENENSLGYNW